MKPNRPHRAPVLPVVDSELCRPTWSVMIPTYNCAAYLRETLQSVLSQDLGAESMQIEVVDDCSTRDNPAKVVEELCAGRVDFFEQPTNQGHIGNFNTCLNHSRGHLIHLLHGDDFVAPGFYQRMQRLFDANPTMGAAFCRHTYVDENSQPIWISPQEQKHAGILDDWLLRIAVKQRVQPPSMVVRREVYEAVGGFDSRICCCAEDWELWVRIASRYQVGYEPESLAFYRMQLNSLTGNCARSGQNLRDVIQAIKIISEYLPKHLRKQLLREARENFADYYVCRFLPKLIKEGDMKAVINQVKEIPKLSHSYRTMRQLTKVITWQS